MDARIIRSIGCLAICLVTALAACGVDEGGEWVRLPGPATSGGGGVGPASGTAVGGPVSSEAEPAPISEQLSGLTCEIPPDVEVEVEDAAHVMYYPVSREVLCLGEPTSHPSAKLCSTVNAFERRAAAIASCFAKVEAELDVQGSRILGREWVLAAMPMLPAVWSKPVAEVEALSHQLSWGMVHLLGGGDATQAQGAPVCFARRSGMTDQESVKAVMGEMKQLVTATTSEVGSVLLALRKGIDVKVTKDLHLDVTVNIVEHTPNTEDAGACMFRVPVE